MVMSRRGRLGRVALITVLGILGGIVITKTMPDVTDKWQHKYTNPTISAAAGDHSAGDHSAVMDDSLQRSNRLHLSYFSFYDARNNLVLDNRPHVRGWITRQPTADEYSWFKRVKDRAAMAVKDPNVRGKNCQDIRYRLLGEIGVELEVTCYTQGSSVSVSMLEPIGPTAVVGSPRPIPKTTLNLAMALSGRVEELKLFLSNLNTVIKKRPQSVVLTIAYFADNNTQEVSKIASDAQDTSNLTVNFLLLNEPFSRGGGLRTALTAMNGTGSRDRIVWLCDVDMAFTEDFIDRCRSTPIRKKQVFLPIVFSQYNPSLGEKVIQNTPNDDKSQELPVAKERSRELPVAKDRSRELPVAKDRSRELPVAKDRRNEGMPVPMDNKGYWRVYGHGNLCAYRTDLLAVGAFSDKRRNWGGEDLQLLQKFYSAGRYRIVRSIEPSLVHRYHPKNCDGITGIMNWNCKKVQISNEASQLTYGLLYYLFQSKESKKV